ncbi:MAG: aminotransferase class V-fold PLP-dependent enzyme [Pseudomonadota bacterium]
MSNDNRFELQEPGAIAALDAAVARLDEGLSLPASTRPEIDDAARDALFAAAERLHDNYPYAHPLYAGQMLKPPHPVARLAYQLAQYVNPNNHALDGGRASSAMEKEAVSQIATMFGLEAHLGHLTSGGTVANLEALWVAREETGGRRVVASVESHYTHSRLSAVLGVPFTACPTDHTGRMSLNALEALLDSTEDVGTVVATAGTTSAGSVDRVDAIVALCRPRGIRVHVDAAYGGYFSLASTLGDDARRAYDAIAQADSVAIDPHKHGLQPYGCGCILFPDPAVGRHYQHDSPYTYFSSDELHLGEISLECSRAGAAAVALWTTQRLLPLESGGTFAGMLEQCIAAARNLAARVEADEGFTLLQAPELDIVVWGVNANSFSESSRLAQAIFEEAAQRDLHLALIDVAPDRLPSGLSAMTADQDTLTCLRSCLMKAEHRDWIDDITARLTASRDAAVARDAA